MIRQPTPASQLYRHWNAAVAGEAPAIHDGWPECGFYKTRLVRGGPWAAVEIKIQRDVCIDTGELTGPERLIAICDGDRRNAERLWINLTPISREEFRAIQQRRESIPAMAATRAKIDLTEEPVAP